MNQEEAGDPKEKDQEEDVVQEKDGDQEEDGVRKRRRRTRKMMSRKRRNKRKRRTRKRKRKRRTRKRRMEVLQNPWKQTSREGSLGEPRIELGCLCLVLGFEFGMFGFRISSLVEI